MNNPLLMFPDGFRAIQAMHEATSAGALPDATLHMVHLRASQIKRLPLLRGDAFP